MPLEQAGVNLQAQGFKDYINKLDQIEKKQREVFDQEFKGTGKSYAQVQRAAKDYERQLKSLEKQYNNVVAQEQKAIAQQQRLANVQANTTTQASVLNNTLGQLAIAAFSRQTAEAVIEAAKAAEAFKAQSIGLNNLAASYGQAGSEIRSAIREAARGTLSETSIILAANKALQLNVAQTPAEFNRVTESALVLGKTLGLDAAQSIDRFVSGLGRKSFLILDDFGLKTEQINEQLEILGQQEFGVGLKDLTQAQQESIFIEAALRAAGQRVEEIGTEVIESASGFDKLNAQAENLKLVLGTAVLPAANEFTDALARALVTAQQLTAFISAGVAGFSVIAKEKVAGADVGDLFNQFSKGEISFTEFLFGTNEPQKDLETVLDEAAQTALETFKDIARAQGVAFPGDTADKSTQSVKENTEALEQNEEQIKALQAAVRQAEQLELSFARAAEDAARKLGRQQANLARTQTRDRDKLLIRQQKELDKFEKDRLERLADFEKDRQKSIASAEKDIAKERERARQDEVDAQRRFQQRLAQEAERFRLSQRQSERRFQLDEKRLRAEGDILGLQQLRENHELEQLEARENFDLQQRQSKESEREQSRDRIKEQQERLEDLKANLDEQRAELELDLEEQRAELLAKFDEQLIDQREAQAEQRADLLRAAAEQEEDRRISQQRQLEDLGRSLADQKDLTAEGTRLIADEIEKIFGVEGVADTIFEGFTTRTESEFQDLFDDIETIVTEGARSIAASITPLSSGINFNAGRRGLGQGIFPQQIPGFQEGGIVPGPRGSPQIIQAHGGETVLPTHRMDAPVIPSQNLNVSMSGGFNITGGEQAGPVVITAALDEMTESLAIALQRLVRRHG